MTARLSRRSWTIGQLTILHLAVVGPNPFLGFSRTNAIRKHAPKQGGIGGKTICVQSKRSQQALSFLPP